MYLCSLTVVCFPFQGKVKPDIVFFGENLPDEFWQFEDDLHAVDLVLIMGTSLEVGCVLRYII